MPASNWLHIGITCLVGMRQGVAWAALGARSIGHPGSQRPQPDRCPVAGVLLHTQVAAVHSQGVGAGRLQDTRHEAVVGYL